MPRIPKNKDKDAFLLELQWQSDRQRIKDAKKVKRVVVTKEDKTYRVDALKSGVVHLVSVMQVHPKSLGRVKGTPYTIHTLCSEDGALIKLENIVKELNGTI